MALGAGVLRQLITVIGFRVNSTEFRQAEQSLYMLREQSMGIAAAGRSAALFLTVPLAMLAKSAIETVATNERVEMSFSAMIGNAAKAKTFVKELYQFAAKSPLFQTKDAADLAKNLYAMGIPLEAMIPTLQMLGKISAATGANIRRIGYDFGVIRATGYADWRHIRMFMNAGVPVMKPLAAALGFNPDDKDAIGKLQAATAKHLVTFAMVQKALQGLTGPKGMFGGIESSIQQSLWGKWQQFTDTVQLAYLSFKDKLLPVLKKVVDGFNSLLGVMQNLRPNTYRFLIILGALVALIGPLILFKGVLWSLIGPFGKIVAIVTALSLAIDDIYGWTKGEKSVMGVLFGDYDAAKAKVLHDSLSVLVDTLKSIGKSTGDIFKNIGHILGLLGDGSKKMNAFSVALWAVYMPLKGIADILNTLSTGFDAFLALPRLFSPKNAAEERANADLYKRIAATPGGAIGVSLAQDTRSAGRSGSSLFDKIKGIAGAKVNYTQGKWGFGPVSTTPFAQSVQFSLADGGVLEVPLRVKVDSTGTPIFEHVSSYMAAKLKVNHHSPEK